MNIFDFRSPEVTGQHTKILNTRHSSHNTCTNQLKAIDKKCIVVRKHVYFAIHNLHKIYRENYFGCNFALWSSCIKKTGTRLRPFSCLCKFSFRGKIQRNITTCFFSFLSCIFLLSVSWYGCFEARLKKLGEYVLCELHFAVYYAQHQVKLPFIALLLLLLLRTQVVQ